VRAGLREGDIGTALAEVAKAHPEVSIGSYPFFSEAGPDTNIVVRSRDPEKLAIAAAAVQAMIDSERARLAV
jgi:molybdopterin-biosynthesis enzyme MoeA-like protein